MSDHTLTTIITAGRKALDRAAYRHPLQASCLRDVAETYARQAMKRAPEHRLARALLADVIVANVRAAGKAAM